MKTWCMYSVLKRRELRSEHRPFWEGLQGEKPSGLYLSSSSRITILVSEYGVCRMVYGGTEVAHYYY